ncbi:MAG: gamma-glutamylcyclotransferase family protein [Cyanobacteria bacterium J06600_6]
MNRSNFVFGYGSLVNVISLQEYLQRKLKSDVDYTICSLNNYRRCWNVAMDNGINLPNYKYYRDSYTKRRIDGFVTFLNIRPSVSSSILGILFRVTDAELGNLDLRERNYQRTNITEQLNIKTEENVWTYIGLPAAEQRYQTGLLQNKAVIAQTYFDTVKNAYLSLGNQEYADYLATTDQPKASIIDLEASKIDN